MLNLASIGERWNRRKPVPELPEVETTVNDLKPLVINKIIIRTEIFKSDSIAEPSAEEFREGLQGSKITGLSRRGKHIVFRLDNGKFLVVHLRMTGALIIKPEGEEPDKFVRVIIYLDNRTAIHFRDVRRFGRMWLVEDINKIVGKLGPEPLGTDFSPKVLARILASRKTPIKALLLDQTLIAGIGNMYADEALFEARIHPLRPANTLNKTEILKLHSAIQNVLKRGILNKGASTVTYIRPGGTKGKAQLEFQVAHRKGEECPVCGGKIERILVGQRSTFFCPKCQKMPRKKNDVLA
jgi:formamidopyrimidine-DNA glycosylase